MKPWAKYQVTVHGEKESPGGDQQAPEGMWSYCPINHNLTFTVTRASSLRQIKTAEGACHRKDSNGVRRVKPNPKGGR